MTRRFPIDGLWLTEEELTRYFLGQLEIESHMRLRVIDQQPLPVPNERAFEPPKKKARPAPIAMPIRGGIEL